MVQASVSSLMLFALMPYTRASIASSLTPLHSTQNSSDTAWTRPRGADRHHDFVERARSGGGRARRSSCCDDRGEVARRGRATRRALVSAAAVTCLPS
eukprot:3236304-Pleurochrysis_carterae.AAC.1